MAYLLDANVFIEGRKRHYGFDICPGFWDWIDRAIAKGTVRSVEQVGGELEAGNDELAAWATARRGSLFLPTDPAMLPSLQAVSTWVTKQNYTQAAVSKFLQDADYYLIARAHAHRDVVVTLENANPTRRNTVPIPNVCIGLGVQFMNPFEMLRTERVRLVLA
ncbi:MAG: DUF4411 family protein [Gemmatimonadaceae bacterium]|nr:DUF4411 family protein [Gemmatimonadaceae bacterium]